MVPLTNIVKNCKISTWTFCRTSSHGCLFLIITWKLKQEQCTHHELDPITNTTLFALNVRGLTSIQILLYTNHIPFTYYDVHLFWCLNKEKLKYLAHCSRKSSQKTTIEAKNHELIMPYASNFIIWLKVVSLATLQHYNK
jgi:hypothetical protein